MQIGAGIGLHLRFTELHSSGAFAGGIADAGGEVANDQHGRMARILKRPQLAEQDRVAQMDIGAGGIDAELDPQRAAVAFGLSQTSS